MHKFHAANQIRVQPYGILIPVRNFRKGRAESVGLGLYFGKIHAANAKSHMALIKQNAVIVLPKDNAGHMIFLQNIPADHEIIVFEVFHFKPGLCPFALEIQAVLPLGYDSLQLLILSKTEKIERLGRIKCAGNGKPLRLAFKCFLQKFLSL